MIAALVLVIAAVAKLRSPASAARALGTLGLPARPALVRAFALVELAIAAWCAVAPSRAGAAALGVLFGAFAVLTMLLARRRAACGCFGDGDAPASLAQAGFSTAFALVALAGALAVPHGVWWVLRRPPVEMAALLIGAAGAVFGVVLAYSEVPRAWASWSAQ